MRMGRFSTKRHQVVEMYNERKTSIPNLTKGQPTTMSVCFTAIVITNQYIEFILTEMILYVFCFVFSALLASAKNYIFLSVFSSYRLGPFG